MQKLRVMLVAVSVWSAGLLTTGWHIATARASDSGDPEVVRFGKNIRALVCRSAGGEICAEKLEPCADDGGQPARLPSGDLTIVLDPVEVDALMPELAPRARTGARKNAGSFESSRIEVQFERYEHARISREVIGGRLESVTIRWLDAPCVGGEQPPPN